MSGEIFVEALGRGEPERVFVHGLAASGRYWREAFRLVEGRRRFVDLAGFGRSLWVEGPYDLEGQVDKLGALRPVKRLVGHSMGGLVALLAASRWSEVESVTCFNLPAYPSEDAAREALRNAGRMERLLADGSSSARAMCWAMCRGRGFFRWLAPTLAPELPPDVARDGVLHTWPSFSQAFTSILVDGEAPEWIGATGARVRVVLAEDDEVAPPDLIEPVLEGTGAEVEVWPGTHQLPLEAAERCARFL